MGSWPWESAVGVGSWIERRARMAPDHVALIAGSRSLTYAELAGRVRRLANGLQDLGLASGDRVAWLGQNHAAFLELFFATASLGGILAPINHRLEPDAVADVLADTEATILVDYHATTPVRVPASLRHHVSVGAAIDGAMPYGERVIDGSPDSPVNVPVAADDVVLLPHTSGTSGRPKGVMLTHANVTWNVVNLLSCADFRGSDVTVAIAPFFRVGGTGVNVLPVLFLGGTVVVPDDPAPDAILASMERHRVSVGFGNPDLLDAITHAQAWPTADLSSLRFIITGGAPVPERLIRSYLDRGIPLQQGYGLSEAAPFVLLLDAADALRKIGSAGKPPLLVDLRVIGEDGGPVPTGDTGELLVRGPNVMAGYWRRPDETHEVVTSDGWLRTGDAARMDDEGFVWIVDRVSARFVSGGHTIYPGEVERVLLEHPAVADAAVVPVPTPERTEVGSASIVLTPGVATTGQELLAFAAARLPTWAVPASVRFVERLPRNSVGKLMRDQLR